MHVELAFYICCIGNPFCMNSPLSILNIDHHFATFFLLIQLKISTNSYRSTSKFNIENQKGVQV
jgi:hypothetical protein